MAITFDAKADLGNNGGSGNFTTGNFTVGPGTDRLLIVDIVGDLYAGGLEGDITSVTWNGGGQAMARLVADRTNGDGNTHRDGYIYGLLNPASGANTITVVTTGGYVLVAATSYAGVKTTGLPDAVSTPVGPAAAATVTTNITTASANDWLHVFTWTSTPNGPPIVNGGSAVPLTARSVDAAFSTWGTFDSNAPVVAAGATSVTTGTTTAGTDDMLQLVVAFAPSAAAAATIGAMGVLIVG